MGFSGLTNYGTLAIDDFGAAWDPLTKSHYLKLNLAMGGEIPPFGGGGPIDYTKFPFTFIVDYVRTNRSSESTGRVAPSRTLKQDSAGNRDLECTLPLQCSSDAHYSPSESWPTKLSSTARRWANPRAAFRSCRLLTPSVVFRPSKSKLQ